MRINVAHQLRQSIGLTEFHKVSEIDPVTNQPIYGEVKMLRTNRSILVSGQLKTTVRAVCSRCLQEFDYPLTLDIEEEYFPTVDVVSGMPLPALKEAEFTIDEHQVIDLAEVVRQYALVVMPMKPVCREDCAGLCPYCGCNLNHQTCGCAPLPDPRWADLGRFILEGKR